MKIWLLALILAAPLAAVSRSAAETDPPDETDGWEAAAPEDPNTPAATWVDSSYDYATDQTQALSEWMDSFFGVPNYEVELPESLVRVDFITDWDEDDGVNNNIRLRGKVQHAAGHVGKTRKAKAGLQARMQMLSDTMLM